jgi:hypothetical protein
VARQLLRCLICTRTEEVNSADILAYRESTWPHCCGKPMAYFVQTEVAAGADDTDPERPALQTHSA